MTAHSFRHCVACTCVALAALLLAPVRSACAEDGDPDPAFAGDGLFVHTWPADYISAETTAAGVAADGSVFVASNVSYPVPQQQFAITVLRLRADGTPDPEFGAGGIALVDLEPTPQVGESANAVFAQPGGGALVLAGVNVDGTMSSAPLLLSLRADGTPDPAFGANGIEWIDIDRWAGSDVGFNVAVRQADGKLVIAGKHVGDASYDIIVARLLPDGNLDPSFGDAGWTRIDAGAATGVAATSIALDDRERILLAGRRDTGSLQPLVARLDTEGNLDAEFGNDGIVLVDAPDDDSWVARAVTSAVRYPAGFTQRRVFVAIGTNAYGETAIVALASIGSLATTFGDNGMVDLTLEEGSRISALAMRGDQRLVAAGSIDPTGIGVEDFLVARMSFDGVLDPSFDGNGVERYAVDPDGLTYDSPIALLLSAERPIVAGRIFNNNLPSRHVGVLRLQSDHLFTGNMEYD